MKLVDCEKRDTQTILFVQDVTDEDAVILEILGFTHTGDDASEQFIDCEKWEKQERLELDLGWAKLVAEKGIPEKGIKEVYIGLETENLWQDIAVVGTDYQILYDDNGHPYCQDNQNEIRLLSWEDPYSEDYTRKTIIKLAEEI